MPVPHKTDNIYGTPEEALQAQKALKQPDLGVYSGQVLSRIFGAGTWIRMFTERSPFMRHMISDLWRIEQKYKGTENNFLFGNISFDEFQLSGKLMNRVHNIKGIKEVFKPLPDVSILKLKELLADGAKNRVSHLDTCNANRANLTDDEKIAYIVMSHIFKRNYEMPAFAQGHLRRLDMRRDLEKVADLVEICFIDTIDPESKQYLKEMRRAAHNAVYLEGRAA